MLTLELSHLVPVWRENIEATERLIPDGSGSALTASERIVGVEALILTAKAETLADAVVQMEVALGWVEAAGASVDPAPLLADALTGLRSAYRAVVSANA